jgi:hypothetical protein
LNGRFFRVERDGTAYWTTDDGRVTRFGDARAWYGTTFLVPWNAELFNVQNGTLYDSDPARGVWHQVGKQGEWAQTAGMSAMDEYLWSIERNGSIYRTDHEGNYTRKGSMTDAQWFAGMGGKLWVIDGDGTMWFGKPTDSKWTMLDDPGAFSDTYRLTVSPDHIWGIDKGGSAWWIDSSGHWAEIAKSGEFRNIQNIIVLNGRLYVVRDGTLYRTSYRNH